MPFPLHGAARRSRSNTSRSMESTTGPRPGGGKHTATAFSASPYAGIIASRRKP